jgi:hypothetical protein
VIELVGISAVFYFISAGPAFAASALPAAASFLKLFRCRRGGEKSFKPGPESIPGSQLRVNPMHTGCHSSLAGNFTGKAVLF